MFAFEVLHILNAHNEPLLNTPYARHLLEVNEHLTIKWNTVVDYLLHVSLNNENLERLKYKAAGNPYSSLTLDRFLEKDLLLY